MRLLQGCGLLHVLLPTVTLFSPITCIQNGLHLHHLHLHQQLFKQVLQSCLSTWLSQKATAWESLLYTTQTYSNQLPYWYKPDTYWAQNWDKSFVCAFY